MFSFFVSGFSLSCLERNGYYWLFWRHQSQSGLAQILSFNNRALSIFFSPKADSVSSQIIKHFTSINTPRLVGIQTALSNQYFYRILKMPGVLSTTLLALKMLYSSSILSPMLHSRACLKHLLYIVLFDRFQTLIESCSSNKTLVAMCICKCFWYRVFLHENCPPIAQFLLELCFVSKE